METADGNLACKWQNDKFWAWKNPRIPNPRTNVRKEAMNHNNAAGHMLLLIPIYDSALQHQIPLLLAIVIIHINTCISTTNIGPKACSEP
jgi:hypothetical protein